MRGSRGRARPMPAPRAWPTPSLVALAATACLLALAACAPSGGGGRTSGRVGTAGPSPVQDSSPDTPRDQRTTGLSSSDLSAVTCPDAGQLPLRAQLAQTFMVWLSGDATTLPSALASDAVPLGGVFVSGTGTAGLRAGTFRALSARPLPPLVAVDEEGGRVHRLASLIGAWPAARAQASTMTPAQVRALARARGERMRALGITLDLAPDVDVSAQPADAVIGDRSFSADPKVVSQYALAFAQGLREAGVLVTLKHFPGHGHATGDTHLAPATTPPLATLERADLLPFRELITALGPSVPVMVGHLRVPGLTSGGTPASLDPAAYRLLRSLGQRGLVLTDELTRMKAVTGRYSMAEAVRAALGAGADMVLLRTPGDLGPLLDQLESAVRAGRLSASRVREAAQAVLDVKTCHPAPG